MNQIRYSWFSGFILICAFASGCGQTHFPHALDTTLTDTNRIVNDNSLTPDQKRAQLSALGIPDLTINALLRDVTNANQFGGTLESALNKVQGGQLDQMTPDEIQLYADATNQASFSDAQAQSLTDLYDQAGIHTRDELKDYLDNPASELPAGLNATDIRAVFVDFNPSDITSQLP